MTEYDFDFRPESYGSYSTDPDPSSIKGTVRRQIAEAGVLDVGSSLAQETLPVDVREAWGGVHLTMMGGEYLPETRSNEVEIARIDLASTMGMRSASKRRGTAARSPMRSTTSTGRPSSSSRRPPHTRSPSAS